MNPLVLCCAALVLLYAALSLNVSRMRGKRRRDPAVTDTDLNKAIRAHGNAAEYIPLYIVLFLYMSTSPASLWVVAVAVIATVSRFLHAAGMFLAPGTGKPHPLRFLGALGTYATLFALGGVLVRSAM
jgi:uncharacterized membrane protein YecN with MAPEG domain